MMKDNPNLEYMAKATAVRDAPTPPRPAELLREDVIANMNNTHALASRVEKLADALVGTLPGADGACEEHSANGYVDSLRSVAAEQRSALRRIDSALDRLEACFDV